MRMENAQAISLSPPVLQQLYSVYDLNDVDFHIHNFVSLQSYEH